ncbi:MAG: hypothetical protein JJT96_15955, partial [Opitutales bacterium]|nr:hypothetical protein [Opitutales bacterium]
KIARGRRFRERGVMFRSIQPLQQFQSHRTRKKTSSFYASWSRKIAHFLLPIQPVGFNEIAYPFPSPEYVDIPFFDSSHRAQCVCTYP